MDSTDRRTQDMGLLELMEGWVTARDEATRLATEIELRTGMEPEAVLTGMSELLAPAPERV